jgi:hypothetical protein
VGNGADGKGGLVFPAARHAIVKSLIVKSLAWRVGKYLNSKYLGWLRWTAVTLLPKCLSAILALNLNNAAVQGWE